MAGKLKRPAGTEAQRSLMLAFFAPQPPTSNPLKRKRGEESLAVGNEIDENLAAPVEHHAESSSDDDPVVDPRSNRVRQRSQLQTGPKQLIQTKETNSKKRSVAAASSAAPLLTGLKDEATGSNRVNRRSNALSDDEDISEDETEDDSSSEIEGLDEPSETRANQFLKIEDMEQWQSIFCDDDDFKMIEGKPLGQLLFARKALPDRQRRDFAPTIFSGQHNVFGARYGYLNARAEKRWTGAGAVNFKITNRLHTKWVRIDGTIVRVGAYETHPLEATRRIIVAFTRASSYSPTYGWEGMFERGAMAAEGYAQLRGDVGCVKVVIPRCRTASNALFSNGRRSKKGALIQEMELVLDAAIDDRLVEILSVGFDGWSTNMNSWAWTYDRWARLDIWIVIIVTPKFRGSQTVFQEAKNGIRYGRFRLRDVVLTWRKEIHEPDCIELLDLMEQVNQAKRNSDRHIELQHLTVGRSKFRVHPNTPTDDAVSKKWRRRRRLLREASP